MHCRRLLLTQCGSRLMWLALIHNELWHKWLASTCAFRTSSKLKFVGVFIKAKQCTATRLNTPGPCKETFTHMTPYRTPRPLQQPVHIMHCPLSDTLDLELSLSLSLTDVHPFLLKKCQPTYIAFVTVAILYILIHPLGTA